MKYDIIPHKQAHENINEKTCSLNVFCDGCHNRKLTNKSKRVYSLIVRDTSPLGYYIAGNSPIFCSKKCYYFWLLKEVIDRKE